MTLLDKFIRPPHPSRKYTMTEQRNFIISEIRLERRRLEMNQNNTPKTFRERLVRIAAMALAEIEEIDGGKIRGAL